jgi:PEP-CTERM motif
MKMHLGKLAVLGAVLAASAPFASATPIAGGSTFTVGGDISGTSSTTPTLTNVIASGGQGTFNDVVIVSDLITANSVTWNLVSGIVGDTFTIKPSDGQVITFTVSSVTLGPDNSASGIGTLTDTGGTNYTADTNAIWSESITAAGQASFTFDTTVPSATPEPSSLILLGTGLLGSASMLVRRRRTV